MKTLFLMCGVPGSGKSTWVRKQMENMTSTCAYVSRDVIRFSMVGENEEYFSHEDEVFINFVHTINYEIICGPDIIFVDATHLNEKSRNKVLDKINTDMVDIIAVDFNVPLDLCLSQNELRKGTRSYVPRSVIRRMYSQYVRPTLNEKHKYHNIITIGEKE